MAVLQELLILVSLFVGGEAARCYNYYYNTYTYYCTYTYTYTSYYDGTGGIVGAVVGSLFGLGTLISLIVVCICCRRRRASMGQVIGNSQATSVTMVTQQTTPGYPTVQPGYPAGGQPATYPTSPTGQPVYPPAPAGQYPPATQPAYPVGAQPFPQQPQAPPYNTGNMYDNNTAPMATGGGITNPGFQPPPPYAQVTGEKQ